MNRIKGQKLKDHQACIWFTGQSGFIVKSCDITLAIDLYLSDSVAKVSPRLTRKYPPPVNPSELDVDIYIVTHDHLDHLDPETIEQYPKKDSTIFVAPRLACKKLESIGIKKENIIKIDSGETETIKNVEITGVYTIPNSPDAIDTAGYKVVFPNGRNFYHTSDTGLSEVLLECAPQTELVLPCINGKWGNMNIEQAATLAMKVKPKYAMPHHYDLMELNSENPETFKYQLNYYDPEIQVVIPKLMEPFIWE